LGNAAHLWAYSALTTPPPPRCPCLL
jgi:hypothetical protein